VFEIEFVICWGRDGGGDFGCGDCRRVRLGRCWKADLGIPARKVGMYMLKEVLANVDVANAGG